MTQSDLVKKLRKRLLALPAHGPVPEDLGRDVTFEFNKARGDLMSGDAGHVIHTPGHALDLLLAVDALTNDAPVERSVEALAILREIFDLPKVLPRLPDDLYDRIDAVLALSSPSGEPAAGDGRWSWGYSDGEPGTPEYEPPARICNRCNTIESRCQCDATPTPTAPSDATQRMVKILGAEWTPDPRWAPTAPVDCVACEGKPSAENSPCAICGRIAPTEPVVPDRPNAYCNKCGFFGQPSDDGSHKRPRDGETCNYTAYTPKPTPADTADRREAVARAIDPDAWDTQNIAEASYPAAKARLERMQRASLCAADRVASLIAARPTGEQGC